MSPGPDSAHPMSHMHAEILQQPAALQATIDALLPRAAEAGELARSTRQVLFIARGTSDNAAVYGSYLIQAYAGRLATLASPSIATTYRSRVDLTGVLAVALSQSGQTDEIVETLAWASDCGARTLAITNGAGSPLAEAADFLDGLRADLSHGGIVVFTPAGDPVKLPSGSTAVDFAYAVSPTTAGASVGVLVNGARKAMENRLAHGQVVDLIAGPYADPPDSWLAAARSGQARTHLIAAIARREAEDAAAAGRIQVARAVAADGASLRDLEDNGTAFSAARRLGHADLDALYEAVGRSDLTLEEFLAALALEPDEETSPPILQ